MPRTARAAVGGIAYHVINRSNGRQTVFHDEEDYAAFVEMLGQARDRLPMRLLAYCLMPNHFHLVLWPHGDGDLGRWMQWLLTAHVRRHHRRRATSGHVWQGRFKAFPIQQDEHLLSVLRYVERNPRRARLVRRAENWAWSSLGADAAARAELLSAPPADRPRNWVERVNRPETDAELAALRTSVNRGRPFGSVQWQRNAAARLGLEPSLRPRGRPRKETTK